MKIKIYEILKELPASEGVFCLKDAENKTLFVGVAENLKTELDKTFFGEAFQSKFAAQISDVEILQSDNLIKLFAETVRQRNPFWNTSLADESLHPFLKITSEDYPRLLVTRKIADDEADYYGAFLPSTGVRLWLEFINRTFRLRICEIPIDGKFPSPCTQFYIKRCLAPCVESLCDHKSYLEMVEIVRIFLRNKRENFADVLMKKIEAAAASLEFEKAAAWRDILNKTEAVFAKKDWQLWLGDAADTFEIEKSGNQIFVYLVTQRGRRILGKKVFVFEKKLSVEETLSQIIWQLYEFYAPREIRVPFDFPNRKLFIKSLRKREVRPVKLTIIKENNERKTSLLALKRARFDFDLKQVKPPAKTEDIVVELKNLFGLSKPPQKIEAFDAAHISGKDFTAAKTVWSDGKFQAGENEFWLLDEQNELKSLQVAICTHFNNSKTKFPDLLLVDGGKAQLQAALKAVSFLEKREFTIICAVKPPGRHNEISHFITETGEYVNFTSGSEAMRILLQLRDDAHELTNKIHRQRRETAHFYELAQILPSLTERERQRLLQKFGSIKKILEASRAQLGEFSDLEKAGLVLKDLKANRGKARMEVKPLIVPLRFDDPNGDAKDLQPLGYTKI